MSAAAAPKIPMGVNMMLASFGIKMDPAELAKIVEAAKGIPALIPKIVDVMQEAAQRIERIEANQKLILKALGVETDAGN